MSAETRTIEQEVGPATNTELRRLRKLCYEQALAGGLPTPGGGSEFGCLMSALDEFLELKNDFCTFANHTTICTVKTGDKCTCGCALKRAQVRRSIV